VSSVVQGSGELREEKWRHPDLQILEVLWSPEVLGVLFSSLPPVFHTRGGSVNGEENQKYFRLFPENLSRRVEEVLTPQTILP